MGLNFYSKKILKLFGICLILPLTILEINLINKQIKAQTNLAAASAKDLFLYEQIGASYLCIASKAEVDFIKALGIAGATHANVIVNKHGGVIKSLGNNKLESKIIYEGGVISIVRSALKICPESIPDNIKKDFEKRLEQLVKQNKK